MNLGTRIQGMVVIGIAESIFCSFRLSRRLEDGVSLPEERMYSPDVEFEIEVGGTRLGGEEVIHMRMQAAFCSAFF